jgi:GPH family glycoside/pentoside/hexuronide:cation symporter
VEVNTLIQLTNEGFDIAVVGNEVLYRKELNEEVIINYINKGNQAQKNVPVSYVDTYNEIINRPTLAAVCDVLLINCYPYWEGVDIKIAGFYLQEMYSKTLGLANGKSYYIRNRLAGKRRNSTICSSLK